MANLTIVGVSMQMAFDLPTYPLSFPFSRYSFLLLPDDTDRTTTSLVIDSFTAATEWHIEVRDGLEVHVHCPSRGAARCAESGRTRGAAECETGAGCVCGRGFCGGDDVCGEEGVEEGLGGGGGGRSTMRMGERCSV